MCSTTKQDHRALWVDGGFTGCPQLKFSSRRGSLQTAVPGPYSVFFRQDLHLVVWPENYSPALITHMHKFSCTNFENRKIDFPLVAWKGSPPNPVPQSLRTELFLTSGFCHTLSVCGNFIQFTSGHTQGKWFLMIKRNKAVWVCIVCVVYRVCICTGLGCSEEELGCGRVAHGNW